MKKYLILLLLLIGSELALNAQHYSRYSQYMFNGLVLNPAYAGTIMDATSFTAFYRNQWTAIEGAPRDISLSAHSPFGERKRVGLGLFLENDRVGLTDQYNLFTSYSYKFELNNGAYLSTGLQAGMLHLRANLIAGDAPDGAVFDPALDYETETRPNFGAGLYYYTENYYFGFSVPYILKYEELVANDTLAVTRGTAQERQYLLTGGFIFPLTESLKLKPSFLFKSIPSVNPFEFDINVSLFIMDSFWIGNSWRFGLGAKPQSTVLMLSYRFPNGMRIGYAYDISLTADLARYSSSHEVMIGFDLAKKTGKGKNSKSGVLSPRYF